MATIYVYLFFYNKIKIKDLIVLIYVMDQTNYKKEQTQSESLLQNRTTCKE